MKKIRIEGFEIEMSLKGEVIIPNEIENIPQEAFIGCMELTSIEIPEGVSISDKAFQGCRNLTHVKISKNVSIGKFTFSGCTKLTNIEIPEGVSIGYGAFFACRELSNIEISKGVSIGINAFKNCIELTHIKILEGVSIGYWAFYGCTGLTHIKILEGVSIYADSLYGCKNLVRVEVSADQDLSIAGLSSGVRIIRRAYYFMPRLPKSYRFGWDSSTFGVGKKLANLVLLCLHRNWSMKSQSLGLPPEMALRVLSFMNVQVSKRIEGDIPQDTELAGNILKPVKAIEDFQKKKWLDDFRAMSEDRIMPEDVENTFNTYCAV